MTLVAAERKSFPRLFVSKGIYRWNRGLWPMEAYDSGFPFGFP